MKDEEYEKYMNMAQMQSEYLRQNDYLRQGISGIQNTRYSTHTHPLEGYDITQMPMDALIKTIDYLNGEYERRTLDTPLQGPTMRYLNKHESVKTAWLEFQTIWKLVGK